MDGEIEDNVAKFYEDIGVSDEDVMSMVIPWKFGAKQLGVFTEEEFVKGMANVGYDLMQTIFVRPLSIIRVEGIEID